MEWQLSPTTAMLLEKAGRAIGWLEHAHRSNMPSEAGMWNTLLNEAHASATLAYGPVRRDRARAKLAEGRDWVSDMHDAPTAAAGMLQVLTGLTPQQPQWHPDPIVAGMMRLTESQPSALKRGGSALPSFTEGFAQDVSDLLSNHNAPALVKAALAMLTAAAVDPDDPHTGMLARHLFLQVLMEADGCAYQWVPPVSWGLLASPGDWERVASVFAVDGAPSRVAVDDALATVFRAVAHGAMTMGYFVEGAGGDARQIAAALKPESRLVTRSQRKVIDVLVGLHSVTYAQLQSLTEVGPRTLSRVLAELEATGHVDVKAHRSDRALDVVRARRLLWKPVLEAIRHYPLPGEPWPDAA
ncbi:hypothetical protein ACNI3K_00500 [Demequina sp. SO4-13]|uniref:hypothetical protein n=1 Tax=Demequina sp. SO4-13 TaxID=3401027 RepID=UPI003AF74DE4